MGAKSSKVNNPRASAANKSRFKSEREQNDESRAKRVGMLCRWLSECNLENEALDFMKQLRELCGELSASLFQRSELQEAVTAEAEKVLYAVNKAMLQFPTNDAIAIYGLEILKLLVSPGSTKPLNLTMYSSQVLRVIDSLIESNGENGTKSFTAEELERFLLCSEIIESFERNGWTEYNRAECAERIFRVYKSLPKHAKKEFASVGLLLIERFYNPDVDRQNCETVAEHMVQAGFTICDAIKSQSDGHDSAQLVSILAQSQLLDINASCAKSGRSPLHFACEQGFTNIVSILIQAGAKVNERSQFGTTPLGLAIEKGHNDIADLLISHGADVLAVDDDGNSALHVATSVGNTAVVKSLLEICDENKRDAIVTAVNKQGMTPLLTASWSAHKDDTNTLKLIDLLVSKGAEVNAVTPQGATALIIAVHRGRSTAVIKSLLDAGCDKHAKCQNMSACDIAEEEGASLDTLTLLRF